MLLSVKIHQFRSCKNVSLRNLSRPIVLLGRNGAGKTNILQAIRWAATMATAGVGQSVGPERLERGHVELTFRLNKVEYTYSVNRSLDVDGPKREPILRIVESLQRRASRHEVPQALFTRDNTNLQILGMDRSATISAETAALSLISALASPGPLSETSDVIAFLLGINYYPLFHLILPSALPSSGVYLGAAYEEWRKKDSRRITSEADLSLSIIDAKVHQPEKFDEIVALLDQRGLGVLEGITVVDIQPQKDHPPVRDRILGIFYSSPGTPTDQPGSEFWQLSMGTQRIVQLVTQIVLDNIAVALIEQPEDAIHPALLRKLLSVLDSYSANFQVVLTSHSPDVFNSVHPRQVRLVTLEDRSTKAVALTTAEIDLARLYMEEQGTFAEFLESM